MNSAAAFTCSFWASVHAFKGPPIIEPRGSDCNELVAICESDESFTIVITFKDFPNVGNFFGREGKEEEKNVRIIILPRRSHNFCNLNHERGSP
nr:MAG TPA: hypothetical protein [Bacteriophage sp.]